jgi:hypothetical protein
LREETEVMREKWLSTGILVLVLSLISALVPAWAPSEPAAAPPPAEGTVVEEEGISMEKPGKFIHTVLFWLKEGSGEAERARLIEECKTYLAAVSTVRYIAVGPPAGTAREVVDNSYDVGLVVHFDDTAGYEVYEDAPSHLEFIDRNNAFWERVQVYDIISQ